MLVKFWLGQVNFLAAIDVPMRQILARFELACFQLISKRTKP